MTGFSRVENRSSLEIEEIKTDGDHGKENQQAEVGEHLGMNEKHSRLGSKMSVNTEGYFSSQQLNGAAPLGLPCVITHELPVLWAHSYQDLVSYEVSSNRQLSCHPVSLPLFLLQQRFLSALQTPKPLAGKEAAALTVLAGRGNWLAVG